MEHSDHRAMAIAAAIEETRSFAHRLRQPDANSYELVSEADQLLMTLGRGVASVMTMMLSAPSIYSSENGHHDDGHEPDRSRLIDIIRGISGYAVFLRHHVAQPGTAFDILAEYVDGLGEELVRLSDLLPTPAISLSAPLDT